MFRGRTRAALAIALASAFSVAFAAQASAFIYWTDPLRGNIGRASIEGTGLGIPAQPAFITGANEPCGVTVDSKFIYWAESGSGTIGRATLNGTHVDHSFITGASAPCGPSTEESTGQLFWANLGGNAIGTALTTGGDVNQNFINPVNSTTPVATATQAGSVFWSNFSGLPAIWRAADDGSGAEELVPTAYVNDTVIGAAANQIGVYWVNTARRADSSIGFAGLDGSNPTASLVSEPDICGVGVGTPPNLVLYYGTTSGIGVAGVNGGIINANLVTGAFEACSNLASNEDNAEATASPSSLSFGGTQVGGGPTAVLSVTLKSSDFTPVPLDIGVPEIEGTNADQFSITNDQCANVSGLGPGGTCNISIEFSPTSLGGKQATLSIPTNDPDSPDMVALTGTGTDPDQAVMPTAIPFGSRLVGTRSPAQTVTLTNEASATLPDQIGQATLDGAGASEYEIADDGCSNTAVAIGDSCEISVLFAPTAAGMADANLSIPSDDPTSPATVALTGRGTEPQASVLPRSLAFGDQQVGSDSPTKSVTVRNLADASGPLVVGSIGLVGAVTDAYDVVFDGCSGHTLSPGDDCSVGVRFTPSSAGGSTAQLSIPSNDLGGTVDVGLSGTGTNPAPPYGFSLGKVARKPNGTATVPVTVPGAGQLLLSGKGVKSRSQSASGAGTVKLGIAPNAASLKRLKRGKQVKVVVKVTFTPTGGQPSSHHAVVKLARPRVG